MGLGSQGHTSWKTDGLKRHEGHCGHNQTAYVCSFTLFFFFIPHPPDYWSHHLHLLVDGCMGSGVQGINHTAGREHTMGCWSGQNAKTDKRFLFFFVNFMSEFIKTKRLLSSYSGRIYHPDVGLTGTG